MTDFNFVGLAVVSLGFGFGLSSLAALVGIAVRGIKKVFHVAAETENQI